MVNMSHVPAVWLFGPARLCQYGMQPIGHVERCREQV